MPRLACLMVTALVSCGCHHYAVQDPASGRVYYTDQWVAADGYTGPLEFEDYQGRRVTLRKSQVVRLSRDDYQEAISAEANTAAPE